MLVLPWAGWQMLRQMEALLREGQEQALTASAEALARAVAARPGGLPERGPSLFIQPLARAPTIDGRFGDWGGTVTRAFRGSGGAEHLQLALGLADDALYLRIEVSAAQRRPADTFWPRVVNSDYLILMVDGSLGALSLRLANAESGALRYSDEDGGPAAMSINGVWRNRDDGFSIELRFPQGLLPEQLGVEAALADASGAAFSVGTRSESTQTLWPLLQRSERLGRPLLTLLPSDMRARLMTAEGFVLADAGELPVIDRLENVPWWRRQLYQLLLYSADDWAVDDAAVMRSDREEVWQALSGVAATAWRREREGSRLLLAAAVPIMADSEGEARVRGALLLEREHQTLLLTDRGVASLIGGTLLALLAAGGVLLLFASRLSWRIGRLRNAAENALERDGRVREFPRSDAKDEIGDLSRSFAKLLDEIAANQTYLRTLAGKLSHELNTPLAITRGALDNIDGDGLYAANRACLARARSGGDRLAGIVRAMSEASRLEQAVASAEFESFDLAALVRDCVAAHVPLLAPRPLDCLLPATPVTWVGAPELIAQALDKLLDNARSFTPEDGWVRVSLQPHGDAWRIAVTNAGPRLPAKLRAQLFDSMVSVRPERRSDNVHLGVGLYLVRLVAELHRGRVSAEDLLDGSGVEFAMILGSPCSTGASVTSSL